MISLYEMENTRNSISFDLLSLMECQDTILKNQEKKNNRNESNLWNSINKKKNSIKNVITNTIKNTIKNSPTLPTSNNRKKRRKVLDLNAIEEEYTNLKIGSVKNQENEKNGDNFMISEKNIVCTRSNKKQIKEKVCPRLANDEEVYMKREHRCGDDFDKDECNETEENKQIEETVNVINKWDDILYTNYKKYYKNCPNCKLYLKELTKRIFLDFLTMDEHINQSEQNLVLLKNKEIEELKKKNGELKNEVNMLKNRNLFLTSKIESVSKNIHNLSCQFKSIMEENRTLKELNNNLSEKIHMWKTKKCEKGKYTPTHLGKGIESQEEEIIEDLEKNIQEEKEEEDSLDKEIFIDVL